MISYQVTVLIISVAMTQYWLLVTMALWSAGFESWSPVSSACENEQQFVPGLGGIVQFQ